ncbi:hypothetical protein QJS04_geneDACA014808 [Acorus gramineus]|uniref:Uncharacterized protein n=1 Tax=Acorus gramineus TaxID=55184 RepID=A0AAV9BM25_ACOGR|nr:hypothetical protein QJS04_geneDACA014808 [Acorus gramineus]
MTWWKTVHRASKMLTERHCKGHAFNSVTGFNASLYLKRTVCSNLINEIRLSSFNLSGAISWTFLSNLTHLQRLDLSKNSLERSIPSPF